MKAHRVKYKFSYEVRGEPEISAEVEQKTDYAEGYNLLDAWTNGGYMRTIDHNYLADNIINITRRTIYDHGMSYSEVGRDSDLYPEWGIKLVG